MHISIDKRFRSTHLIIGVNEQYLLYSRVPKCGSETTLALMTNISIANNVTMEVHQNRKYFEHQWFRPDSSSVRFHENSHVWTCICGIKE